MAIEQPRKLRTELRTLIEGKALNSRLSVPEIVKEITARESDLCEQEKARLFAEAIGSWARKILRQRAGVATDQLELPIEELSRYLPRRVAVWSTANHSVPADYVGLAELKLTELDAHIASLKAKTKTNKELLAFNRLRKKVAPYMRNSRDTIGSALAAIAKSQAKKVS